MAWLFGWSYRKSHVINPASGAGKNYQIKIKVHYGNGDDSGENVYLGAHSRKDFGDVRFTKADGVTELNYWIEEKTDSDYAIFWVKISDNLSDENVTIFIYYGKNDATTTSNGENTFLFFDDFPGTALDLSKWNKSGSPTISNSELLINSDYEYIKSKITFLYKALKARIKIAPETEDNSYQYFGFQPSPVAYSYHEEMFFTSDGDLEVFSGNDSDVEGTSIYSSSYFGSYHNYEILWKNGQAKFVIDDELRDTDTSCVCDSTQPVGIYNRQTYANLYVDWVFVRNYVDPEPSHGSWGEEEKWYPPWLSGWFYRKSHSINPASNAGKDYQIKIKTHYGSGTDSGEDVYLNNHCRIDFGDIRFTQRDGTTLIDYWMEEKVDSDYAVFWVKVPSIPANGTADIHIYYGNPDAVYDGDPEQVFDLYDDFEDGVIDSDRWSVLSGSWSESGGSLHGTGSGWSVIKSPVSGTGYEIAAKGMDGGGGSNKCFGVAFDVVDGDDLKAAMARVGADRWTIEEVVGGSETAKASYPETLDVNTWYEFKVRLVGATAKIIRNDTEIVSYTFGSEFSGPIGLTHEKGDAYFDYIRIRKYVDPEPSISAIGSEEYYLQESTTTIPVGEVSAQLLNADGESLSRIYDACDTQFYRFKKWPQGHGSFTYRNSGNWGSDGASASDKRMGILHGYCLKLTPDSLGSDGEIYYPSSRDLNLDLSWAKWLRLYLYADHEEDVTIKVRLHQDADNYFEGSLVVKAKEWRKYEISMDSLSQVGSPSLSQINWISIIAPYPILIDSDHVFLPAVRELMRVKFTLRRDSPDDPSPKIKLVKLVWREGA